MAKNLVFSGYKWLEVCLEAGLTDDGILGNLGSDSWVARCEGMTAPEMRIYPLEMTDGTTAQIAVFT